MADGIKIWKSPKEPPDTSREVLIRTKKGIFAIARYNAKFNKFYTRSRIESQIEPPVAWAEIPEYNETTENLQAGDTQKKKVSKH